MIFFTHSAVLRVNPYVKKELDLPFYFLNSSSLGLPIVLGSQLRQFWHSILISASSSYLPQTHLIYPSIKATSISNFQ